MDSLLPPNATPTERALEAATARVGDVTLREIGTIWQPDTCRVDLLPWLAWAVGVPEWSSTWPETVQRNAIRATIITRRYAGTSGAIRRAIEALGVGIDLSEWFEHGGAPGTATAMIQLETFGLPEEDMGRLDRAINLTKRASAHLTVTIALAGRHARGIASIPVMGEETVLYPPWTGYMDGAALQALRPVLQLAESIEVTPPFPTDFSVTTSLLRAAAHSSEVVSVRPPKALDESVNQFNSWYEGYTQ